MSRDADINLSHSGPNAHTGNNDQTASGISPSADTQLFENGALSKPENIHITRKSETLTNSQFGDAFRSNINKRIPTLNELDEEETVSPRLLSSFKLNPEFKSKQIAKNLIDDQNVNPN